MLYFLDFLSFLFFLPYGTTAIIFTNRGHRVFLRFGTLYPSFSMLGYKNLAVTDLEIGSTYINKV